MSNNLTLNQKLEALTELRSARALSTSTVADLDDDALVRAACDAGWLWWCWECSHYSGMAEDRCEECGRRKGNHGDRLDGDEGSDDGETGNGMFRAD